MKKEVKKELCMCKKAEKDFKKLEKFQICEKRKW